MKRALVALALVVAGLLAAASQADRDIVAFAFLMVAGAVLAVAAGAVLYRHTKEWCADES
ncbi:hypothetical protein PQQ87_17965 [Paraburkholderia nemoris]|uniref:hypothetical protein n=1 Tax=Paraburkholderia nemoris TaxID=2793076 RepID=UPI0038BB1470